MRFSALCVCVCVCACARAVCVCVCVSVSALCCRELAVVTSSSVFIAFTFSGFPYVFFRIFQILQKQLLFLVPNGLYFQPLISFLGMGEENSLYVLVAFLAAHK